MSKEIKDLLISEVTQMDDEKWYTRGSITGTGKWWKESIVAIVNMAEKAEHFLLWGKKKD